MNPPEYQEALTIIDKLTSEQQDLLGLCMTNQSGNIKDSQHPDLEILLQKGLIGPFKKIDGSLDIGYSIPVHIAWCVWCSGQETQASDKPERG